MCRAGSLVARRPLDAEALTRQGAMYAGRMAKNRNGKSGGNPVYGLDVIGAWVYFWRRAETPRERALGMFKGLVWPAILVYEGFSALSGRSPSGEAQESAEL
jgi:hypothetical protein